MKKYIYYKHEKGSDWGYTDYELIPCELTGKCATTYEVTYSGETRASHFKEVTYLIPLFFGLFKVKVKNFIPIDKIITRDTPYFEREEYDCE